MLTPVGLALLHRAGEGFVDMVVDMRPNDVEVALPEGFEDQPIGALRALEEAGDVEGRVGGEERANARAGGRNEGQVAGVSRGRAGPPRAG